MILCHFGDLPTERRAKHLVRTLRRPPLAEALCNDCYIPFSIYSILNFIDPPAIFALLLSPEKRWSPGLDQKNKISPHNFYQFINVVGRPQPILIVSPWPTLLEVAAKIFALTTSFMGVIAIVFAIRRQSWAGLVFCFKIFQ